MRERRAKGRAKGVKRYAVGRSWRAVAYRIVNARGESLADVSRVPYRWSDRDPLVWLMREDAEVALARHFVGPRVARELGVRVVRV